jgi:glycosyltransferase involved in cell wall biosynthesis
MAGAGGVALRGALALDPERYEVLFIIGSGNRLIQEARDAGFEVVIQEHLRSEISIAHDRAALAELKAICRTEEFDVVHTHSAKAGALGRLAAHDARVGRIVHTYHGFPFHAFQSRIRRRTYIRIEKSLARFTDAFLAVGPAVAAEAIVRQIAPPERVRTIGVAVSNGHAPDLSDQAEARRLLGIPPGMRAVGTVGRLDFQKAPEDFVNALARLEDGEAGGASRPDRTNVVPRRAE